MKTATELRTNKAQNEPEWLASTDDVTIGKDVLELVSTAMYVDPMSIYREYIQNAADSIDEARRLGLIRNSDKSTVDISIDSSSRTVRIRDNGTGIPKAQFGRRLTSLGASPKRGASARGFRGVGRLSGLAYCQELIFRSRASGEASVSELRWDCRRLRSALRDARPGVDLKSLIKDVVAVRRVPAQDQPERFFEVELSGVVRQKSDKLLHPQAVADYLAQVAPVPFSPEFTWGSDIAAALAPRVALADLEIHVSGVPGPIYRPHHNALPMGDDDATEYRELELKYITGPEGETSAILWLLHHGYHGAIPQESMVKGLRLRVGNIQIGEHSLLEELFPEQRFNAWTVGELHIVDPRIVPNGRRDHFEQNSHYNNILNQLAPIARDIARRCRTSSMRRKWLRDFEVQRSVALEKISIISQGSLSEKAKVELGKGAERAISAMEKIARIDTFDFNADQELEPRVRDVRSKLSRALRRKSAESPLAELPSAKRKMYEHLFALIYECSANRVAAKSLVDRIMEKVT